MIDVNVELGNAPHFINSKCGRCGAGTKEAILNFEGFIHHNSKIICIDHKACKKRMKKLKNV